MAFAVYDAGERRLTLAMPRTLSDFGSRWRSAANSVGGIPLGLFPDTEYDEVTIKLRPGDTVLFASDGILESENAEEQEFGFQRLTAVIKEISPAAIRQ